ncbi:MAG: NAD-dependent epimerase/dehydratase family protein [Polyangiaceae bacterium]|nr:NAD-dependent epimerase/dehydratase family protein [Polyangiaceae bacterium]
MRALVTGGAGSLGCRLVERLAARGAVTVLDDLSTGTRARLAPLIDRGAVELVRGDVRILSDVDAVMSGHDAVFHLAASAEHGDSDDTRLDLEVGTIATHNVLEAARRRGVPRVVLSSSAEVYGDVDGPVDEADLGALPSTLRGASKLASEALAAAFARTFAMSCVVVRAGAVVGPGRAHPTLTALDARIEAATDALLLGGDGERLAGFTHVDDWVEAALLAFDRAPAPLSALNVAPRDLLREDALVAARLAASARPSLPVRFVPGAPPLPWPRVQLSGERLAALGFAPSRGSEEALGDARKL